MSDRDEVFEAARRLRVFLSGKGTCRVVSVGKLCACPLCDVDRLMDAVLDRQPVPSSPERP